MTDDTDIRWANMNKFAEDQTREIERQFHSSRPKPRNRVMGFTGKDRYLDDLTAPQKAISLT